MKCFVDNQECLQDCALFRRGFRYNDNGKEPTLVEGCALNFACDALENIVSRNIGVEKEMNMVRGSLDGVKDVFTEALKKRKAIR
jgi:hypothetical protein